MPERHWRDDHRWDAPPKVRFATDSPLEESGFEPSVPPVSEEEVMPEAGRETASNVDPDAASPAG